MLYPLVSCPFFSSFLALTYVSYSIIFVCLALPPSSSPSPTLPFPVTFRECPLILLSCPLPWFLSCRPSCLLYIHLCISCPAFLFPSSTALFLATLKNVLSLILLFRLFLPRIYAYYILSFVSLALPNIPTTILYLCFQRPLLYSPVPCPLFPFPAYLLSTPLICKFSCLLLFLQFFPSFPHISFFINFLFYTVTLHLLTPLLFSESSRDSNELQFAVTF